MASFNKVILVGNLVRDPELRVTPKGTALCIFSLAVNRKYVGADTNMHEEVLFIDLEAWSKAAENIAKYCTKGSPLLVEGHLKLDQWEDKTTKEKRSKIKVVVGQFQFLRNAPSERTEAGPGGPYEAPGTTPAPRPTTFSTRTGAPVQKPAAPPEEEDVQF